MSSEPKQSQSQNLVIAVPSKGRLMENAQAFFARAGLTLAKDGGARDYRGMIKEMPSIGILYLSASEIVSRLANGDCHFGITGEDLLREALPDADAKVGLLSPLGFGHADVVVAVPKGWIDCASMADLEEIAAEFHARHGRRMRVATKYVNLSRQFLAAHGVTDYRIVESIGATEGAPAAGTAEFIVDITTTGATLEANGLKVLADGVILRSEAQLTASRAANWTVEARTSAARLLARFAAEKEGRDNRDVVFMAQGLETEIVANLIANHGGRMAGINGGETRVSVPGSQALTLASALTEMGAERVAVQQAAFVFSRDNALSSALEALLPRQ